MNMKSIRTVFLFVVLGVMTILLLGQTIISTYQITSGMEVEVKRMVVAKAGEVSNSFLGRINEAAEKADAMTLNLKSINNIDVAMSLTDEYIKSDDLIFGSGYFFEPNAYDSAQKYYGPYKYKDGGNIKLTWDYSNAEYDYFKYDWYKKGLATDNIAWSEPFYDEVSKITMLTIAKPIIKDNKKVGVVTVDLAINQLEDYIKSIKVGEQGYAFIVTGDGYYLATTDAEKNLKVKISEDSVGKISQVGKTITDAKESMLVRNDAFGADSYVSVTPIGTTGLKLVLVLPTEEFHAGINKIMYANIMVFVMILIAISLLIIYLFNNRINMPLTKLIGSAKGLASGDLTTAVSAERDDEIGELAENFKIMSNNFKKIITDVNRMAQQVASSGQELCSGSEQSAVGTQEIAQSIVKVAEAVAEQSTLIDKAAESVAVISNSINTASDSAEKTLENVESSAVSAKNGYTSVKSAIGQMENIDAKINEAAETVLKLGTQSKQIGEIVSTISDIAGQTNLLALNAAIEAARAGEQGRGFAVVADEVRKLAEQSQVAAKHIADLIREIQTQTTKAVEFMETGTQEVKLGSQLVGDAGKTFSEIVTKVDKVTLDVKLVVAEIKKIVQERDSMVKLIDNLEVIGTKTSDQSQNVSATVEEQAASLEQLAAVSRSLSEMSQELHKVVNSFKV
ncbi:MAG: HAMP domain-containing protein [Negativicutes bacterium]|nr:HAMP domain-containing protein [Negativicutes bacterium]